MQKFAQHAAPQFHSIVRMDQIGDPAFEQILAAHAQHRGHGRIHVDHPAFGVTDADGDGGIVEYHPESRLGGIAGIGHRRVQHFLMPCPGGE